MKKLEEFLLNGAGGDIPMVKAAGYFVGLKKASGGRLASDEDPSIVDAYAQDRIYKVAEEMAQSVPVQPTPQKAPPPPDVAKVLDEVQAKKEVEFLSAKNQEAQNTIDALAAENESLKQQQEVDTQTKSQLQATAMSAEQKAADTQNQAGVIGDELMQGKQQLITMRNAVANFRRTLMDLAAADPIEGLVAAPPAASAAPMAGAPAAPANQATPEPGGTPPQPTQG